MIRGLAALFVLTGHVRGLFFIDYKDLPHPSWLLRMIYALTGLGHEAVMVFFVLSGFFIGGSVLSTLERWSWRSYLVNRLTRLYVVLIPALLLTAAIDQVSMQMPGGHTFFDLPIPHFTSPHGRDSLPIFLGNLFFQQDILVPAFGTDSPLWSLANEFWYYLLFPMIALLFVPRFSAMRKALLFAGVCGIFFYTSGSIRIGFGIWMLGVALHFIPAPRVGRWLLLAGGAVSALVFVGALGASRAHRIPDLWADPAVGFSFALWLFFIVKAARTAQPPRAYQSISKSLSKCSYSVYAVHLPVVYLVRASIGSGYWQPSAAMLAGAAGISLVAFLSGYVFSRLTEAHTDFVRNRVFRMFAHGGRAVAAAA